jgi:hypothetical protein
MNQSPSRSSARAGLRAQTARCAGSARLGRYLPCGNDERAGGYEPFYEAFQFDNSGKFEPSIGGGWRSSSGRRRGHGSLPAPAERLIDRLCQVPSRPLDLSLCLAVT